MTAPGTKWRKAQMFWMSLVVSGAVYFAIKNAALIDDARRSFSTEALLTSFALLFIAKLFLTGFVRAVARANDISVDWRRAWSAYSLSQIPKYLPGSIWQFISRSAIYRSFDASAKSIATAIPLEVLLLVGSAFAIGVPAAMVSADAIAKLYADKLTPDVIASLSVMVLALTALLVMLLRTVIHNHAIQIRLRASYLFYLVGAWAFLGLSFAALLQTFGSVEPVYAISSFALAYGVGAIAVFAPAGVGVREAILTATLAPFIGPVEALLAASAHRIVYFCADLFCAGIASVIRIKPQRATQS